MQGNTWNRQLIEEETTEESLWQSEAGRIKRVALRENVKERLHNRVMDRKEESYVVT